MYQLSEVVRQACETILDTEITDASYVGGGDINEARCLQTAHGRVFLKMNNAPIAADMLSAEAKGLRLLAQAGQLRTPKVLGQSSIGDTAFLLLEFIETTSPKPRFWADFGRALADLHRTTQPDFGLDFDNFIGTLPQSNSKKSSWTEFYVQERLDPQVKLAYENAQLTWEEVANFTQLYQKLPDLFPVEPPTLIHGDLWSGNYLCDDQHQPVLIDPATSYAHRELDIAMTKLFGGFAPDFYRAYHEQYPLTPGWEARLPLGQLYYLLVHVNLFGGGYVTSVRRILRQFK